MPFEQGTALSFTAISIEKNVPDSSGVYGLSNAREWIFIGETANLRVALMQHFRDAGSNTSLRKPSGFSYELAAPFVRVERRTQLVRELKPWCSNRD